MNLDNREIAFLTWSVLLGGGLIWKQGRPQELGALLRTLVKRPILCVLGTAACYVATCVWLLSIPGWWQKSNLKTTLMWAFGFALVSMFNYEKVASGKTYFRAVVVEAVGITACVSFISSSYTFSLLSEVILAFALITLVVLSAISERDGALKSVKALATALLVLLSLLMLGNSLYQIFTNVRDFTTSHTAREFALPVLLTSMFLPFLYGLYVYVTYERVFGSFDFSIKDPLLRLHARRKAVVGFWLDTVGLERWRRHAALFELRSLGDIDESIREVKQARNREKRPYRVPPPLGWLPGQATSFLSSLGLSTNDYHRSHEGWWANSTYLDLGQETLPNNVAYYVSGDEFVVRKLKLVLNVNVPESAERIYERFSEMVSTLLKSAIPSALWNDNELQVSADGAPLLFNGYVLALKRHDWPSGIKGGHELVLTIEIADTPQAID